ncbi:MULTISPECIES: DMT family transporter [unclassified Gilliamella]|uniref:DMT family transporter n=1 Tax=unclassified Gilliamella TaxID=2685620 RepID=UPI0022699FB2|nr:MULTISPECIES: DMT family transporter [unclassified Gilliamella]MCX8596328.1 DMT family transporter [Gilliamella sp. B3493]MCX8598695.1 DMT family transporter [Gilliamella sp. B3486]MCX8660596.1 DMT family transporter [Gilliamella sp. B2772]MCX8682859.1 DMT family transporter [Gilliamella sp. B2889]MCX8689297.1 DMT family transporter [Gilliamella sp. B2973]
MKKKITILLVILSTFFWGTNFNAGSIVVSSVSPLTAASERFIIATLAIFVFMIIKDKGNINAFKLNWKPLILLGLCGITGFNLAFFIGLQTTSALNGALIMATSPVTTILISSITEKHRVSLPQTVGMLISLIGVILVISHGDINNIFKLHFTRGDLIILLGNLAWATYTVGCRRFISDSTPLQTTAFTMLFGTIGIVVFSFYQSDLIKEIEEISTYNQIILIYMGLVGSVLAYLFWNVGIKELGAANTSLFFNFVPVFTLLLAFITGTIPNLLQLAGALLVISGVIYATGSYQILKINR